MSRWPGFGSPSSSPPSSGRPPSPVSAFEEFSRAPRPTPATPSSTASHVISSPAVPPANHDASSSHSNSNGIGNGVVALRSPTNSNTNQNQFARNALSAVGDRASRMISSTKSSSTLLRFGIETAEKMVSYSGVGPFTQRKWNAYGEPLLSAIDNRIDQAINALHQPSSPSIGGLPGEALRLSRADSDATSNGISPPVAPSPIESASLSSLANGNGNGSNGMGAYRDTTSTTNGLGRSGRVKGRPKRGRRSGHPTTNGEMPPSSSSSSSLSSSSSVDTIVMTTTNGTGDGTMITADTASQSSMALYWSNVKDKFVRSSWYARADQILMQNSMIHTITQRVVRPAELFYNTVTEEYAQEVSSEQFVENVKRRVGPVWDWRLKPLAMAFHATARAVSKVVGAGRLVGGAIQLGRTTLTSSVNSAIDDMLAQWDKVLVISDEAVDKYLPDTDAPKLLTASTPLLTPSVPTIAAPPLSRNNSSNGHGHGGHVDANDNDDAHTSDDDDDDDLEGDLSDEDDDAIDGDANDGKDEDRDGVTSVDERDEDDIDGGHGASSDDDTVDGVYGNEGFEHKGSGNRRTSTRHNHSNHHGHSHGHEGSQPEGGESWRAWSPASSSTLSSSQQTVAPSSLSVRSPHHTPSSLASPMRRVYSAPSLSQLNGQSSSSSSPHHVPSSHGPSAFLFPLPSSAASASASSPPSSSLPPVPQFNATLTSSPAVPPSGPSSSSSSSFVPPSSISTNNMYNFTSFAHSVTSSSPPSSSSNSSCRSAGSARSARAVVSASPAERARASRRHRHSQHKAMVPESVGTNTPVSTTLITYDHPSDGHAHALIVPSSHPSSAHSSPSSSTRSLVPLATKLGSRLKQRIPAVGSGRYVRDLASRMREQLTVPWFAKVDSILLQNPLIQALQGAATRAVRPAEHFFQTAVGMYVTHVRAPVASAASSSVDSLVTSLRSRLGPSWDERLWEPARAFFHIANGTPMVPALPAPSSSSPSLTSMTMTPSQPQPDNIIISSSMYDGGIEGAGSSSR